MSARELTLYRRLAELLVAPLEVGEVASRTAALVVEAVDASVCFVHAVDHERGRLTLIGATPPFDRVVGRIQLGLGDGIAGWVAQTGRAAVVPDKWADHRYRYIPELGGEHFTSLVSVPLARDGRPTVGVLNVHWREAIADLEHEASVIEAAGRFLVGALEHALLADQLVTGEAALERFATELIRAQEAERRRVQLDLHDGVAQSLHAAAYRLEGLRASAPPALASELTVVRDLVRAANAEVSRLVRDPGRQVLEDFGLAEALQSVAHGYPDLEVQVDVELDDLTLLLEPERGLAVMRICQEALNNVASHAATDAAELRARRVGDDLVVTVRDRGVGFEPEATVPGRLGLVGMRERARLLGGTIEIFSRLGEGTLVRLRVPIVPSVASS
ncbi:GAF sensor signal transduction histidine kinase [Acidimicrobium ferrooxidans DSM 10331]|uniref:histidine kinase n=1 Tax=Acidimicrobium ferrooxidans (strain DSM 10331 / JCM 15462 / NBRC 103882 / ICP) TaxID=525909 RepID=C7M252_ACIFD|nr:GAF domain-containing protein [Acidimicrobium ferrooxidans]ACU53150.1 GAF sensor signal transduction histidine kinase [Acidimicrobium ferrooxidans DSM 10331]